MNYKNKRIKKFECKICIYMNKKRKQKERTRNK